MHALAASDPLVAPTWLTAIATVTLAAGAIVTAVFAYLAFRGQAQELLILQSQAADDREDRAREAADRRRQRAAMVYVTTDYDKGLHVPANSEIIAIPRTPSITLTMHNTGPHPVYDVHVHWVDASEGAQGGEAEPLGTLPPGDNCTVNRKLSEGENGQTYVPVAYFRDATGIGWTLLGNGELDEVEATYPAGAPLIATTAVERSRKRAQDAAELGAALTDAGQVLAEAADNHPSGTRRHGFWRTPRAPSE